MKPRVILFVLALLAGLGLTLAIFTRVLLPGPENEAPISARTDAVIYLAPLNGSEVWLQALDGSPARQLTATGGRVTAMDALRDGSYLAVVVENHQGGSDLMQVALDGSGANMLVECGADLCAAPASDPAGRWLAFTRANAAAPDHPSPWLLDLTTNEAAPLELDTLIRAVDFSWSPDGSRLAFYDPAASGVRVHEMDTGRERVIQANVPQSGSWSPDGRLLTVNNEEGGSGLAVMKVYRYDMDINEASVLLGAQPDDAADYSVPRWSPDGQWLAFAQVRLAGNPARQVWIIRPDGTGARAVTENLSFAHGGYRWSPDSTRLAYQRYALGASENVPEVMLWDMRTGKEVLLAENAYAPLWLP